MTPLGLLAGAGVELGGDAAGISSTVSWPTLNSVHGQGRHVGGHVEGAMAKAVMAEGLKD